MAFYDDIAAAADSVLREFGAVVTLIPAGIGTYDPATGTAKPPKTTQYTGVGARLDYTAQEKRDSLIQQGSVRVYLSTVGMKSPQPGDTLKFIDASYIVIDSKPIAPATTPVLFDCQVSGV